MDSECAVVARWALLVSSEDPVLLSSVEQGGSRVWRGLD